jgi:hypothetical protein
LALDHLLDKPLLNLGDTFGRVEVVEATAKPPPPPMARPACRCPTARFHRHAAYVLRTHTPFSPRCALQGHEFVLRCPLAKATGARCVSITSHSATRSCVVPVDGPAQPPSPDPHTHPPTHLPTHSPIHPPATFSTTTVTHHLGHASHSFTHVLDHAFSLHCANACGATCIGNTQNTVPSVLCAQVPRLRCGCVQSRSQRGARKGAAVGPQCYCRHDCYRSVAGCLCWQFPSGHLAIRNRPSLGRAQLRGNALALVSPKIKGAHGRVARGGPSERPRVE